MAILFNDNFQTRANKPTDSRYMDYSGGQGIPYASVAAAVSAVLAAYRYQYLTVWALAPNGDPLLYWWRADTTDASLEPKDKESYTLNATGTITMIAPYYVYSISVQPTNNIANLQIGTTIGGTDLEPGTAVNAGTTYTLAYGARILTNTTIFLTGLATGTKVIVDKKF